VKEQAPGPRRFDARFSDDIVDLFRHTAAERHRQIDTEPP
jgi:hypothetical protein